MSGDETSRIQVQLPTQFRGRLEPQAEFRMGVWKVAVEFIDGTVINDLFTNGVQIYRLVGWSGASFEGERAPLYFEPGDIRDIQSSRFPFSG